ncbi:MAG: transposase, partial [Erysipelotrichaceae bacterium]|nr:transposase [Erysipelotrichaceae bacterium]
MYSICTQDNAFVQKNFKSIKVKSIVPSVSSLADDIILSMADLRVLKCLDDAFIDKRGANKTIPLDIIMTLSVAAKLKCRTSLIDIPYALQNHNVLAKLGYNIFDNDDISFENENGAMVEGSIRHLIKKYDANEFVDYYNTVMRDYIMRKLNIVTSIHIIDVTKIKVNFDNENYELATKSYDANTETYYRGYKLSALRGIVDDGGIIEEIRFGTAETHDLHLSEEMLKTSHHLHEGDILIEDRGFLSRKLINYMKNVRGVDVYVPLRKNMTAFEEAVKIAKKYKDEEWQKHPNPKRENQLITLVCDLGDFWDSEDKNDENVDFNACVVWYTDTNEYSVFITTDTSKDAKQIISIYEMRTEIEEDFRQVKDFWKLEDFKSTKLNFILFHVISTLLAYLFFQLYCMYDEKGEKYEGKSFPVLIKRHEAKPDGYYIIYYEDKFGIFTMDEILNMA